MENLPCLPLLKILVYTPQVYSHGTVCCLAFHIIGSQPQGNDTRGAVSLEFIIERERRKKEGSTLCVLLHLAKY